jgi:heat shock protein HslJ
MPRSPVLALCLALLLSACGAQTAAVPSPTAPSVVPTAEPTPLPSSAPSPVPPATHAADPLAVSSWVLVTLDGAAPPPELVLRLEFQNGYARGFAGCNFLDGPYETDGTTLRLSEVAQTQMLCLDTALMQREEAFVEALRMTASYALTGQSLELRDSTGTRRLVFQTEERQVLDPARLVGTRWSLEALAGEPVTGERPLTLELQAGGKASGDAGCRTFAATWQAEGDRIDFPMIQMLQEHCADQALLVREGMFTDALSTAHSYRLIDGQLEIRSDRHGPLRFVALP